MFDDEFTNDMLLNLGLYGMKEGKYKIKKMKAENAKTMI